MVEIKTFLEVSNNVYKLERREEVVLILEHINMAFAGFLPCCLSVLLVYHFYFQIRLIMLQLFGRKRFLFNSVFSNAFQNIKFLMQMSL